MSVARIEAMSGLVPFVTTHFFASCIAGPAMIVIFDFGMADPVTSGWPTALIVFFAGCVLTGLDSLSFAVGLYSACINHLPDRWYLKVHSIGSALVCLVVAPFLCAFEDFMSIYTEHGFFVFAAIIMALISVLLGWSSAKLGEYAAVRHLS
jgi:hypothetical protein